ncbi:MAG TPA: sigma 54-interacting transcriptional regulator, partial [Planctomycetota bacterium]|nr:sigma 54-interacting transcriptional regulator [Planctomycetota bacterium]
RKALACFAEEDDAELAWNVYRALGLALAGLEDRALSEAYLDRAARVVREIEKHLPPGQDARFRTREGVRELVARPRGPLPGDTPPPPAPGSVGSALFDALVSVNEALTAEHDRKKLLEKIMDSALSLGNAERGFLMTVGPSGKLKFRVGRDMAHVDITSRRNAVSNTIVGRVIDRGEPVIVADARSDPAYRGARSIIDLQLASVLCVPLKFEGRVVGVLYLDHRFRTAVFGDPQVKAIQALANQAAIALENARLFHKERKQRQEIEDLARRLEEKLVQRDRELVAMQRSVDATTADAETLRRYAGLIGSSPAMVQLYRLLDRVCDSDLPVLVTGESGTGKELVARAIHFNGGRRLRPFVAENCSAIPASLLEAELFGAKKGSYTGATADRAGLFEVASGGTLFLDEVGDMSLDMQAKLLRALERNEVRPVGSTRMVRIDVRIVAATNKDLRKEVADGRFRQDLFYRLNVLSVQTPPLRDRPEDIPLLVESFLQRIAEQRKEPKKQLAPGVLDLLSAYRWPGNVRELLHEIERAAQLSDAVIGVAALSSPVRGVATDAVSLENLGRHSLDIARRAGERRVLLAALEK